MTSVILPSICDRAAARALYPDFRDGVGATPLTVDASAVERIGQAMIQLLVSAAGSEAGITVTAPSDPFCEAVRMSGLQSTLGTEIAT